MPSRFILVLVLRSPLCIFDYTVYVPHHHHCRHYFFDFALVCERQQQPVVEFCSFCRLQKLIKIN